MGGRTVLTWEAKQAEAKPETCIAILSRAGSALSCSWGMWMNTAVQVGFGYWRALRGYRKSFCCAIGGIFFGFLYFPFFFCRFIIMPFLQGPQIPSQSSGTFIKCRPVYTSYLKMCGPEINIPPNQPYPRVLYSWKTVNSKKNREPGAESHFQLHNYWREMAFLNLRCGNEVGTGQRCYYTG